MNLVRSKLQVNKVKQFGVELGLQVFEHLVDVDFVLLAFLFLKRVVLLLLELQLGVLRTLKIKDDVSCSLKLESETVRL